MTLALARDYRAFWWLSIGLGFAILAIVIILLSLLASLVKDIDRNVADLDTTVQAMATSTGQLDQLDEAAVAAGRLRAEAEA